MVETILDGSNKEPPGRRVLEGSDLEIAYNRIGDNLVLRVNKGPVQVFRVLLVDAFKHIDEHTLFEFNSIAPDFDFKVGDVFEALLATGRSTGLNAEQMSKLKVLARGSGR
jgi:hypothetical protein